MTDKKKIPMIKMYAVVTIVVIIGSLFIVGFAYNFLIENGIVTLDENNPMMGIIPLLALSALASIVFSIILGITIIRPMKTFQEAFEVISEGQLDYRLELESNVVEVQAMRDGFNHMVEDLSVIETLSNDFIANVSHEFKTPLSTIEAYAVLLQSKDLDDEKREQYIRAIRNSAQDLSVLTDNILKISRLDHSVYDQSLEAYRLDEQIRNIILMNEKAWTTKDIEFDLDLESMKFVANQNLVSQIWQNLIDNAIKFSHPQGLIKISLKSDEKHIVFVIEDYGIGIKEAELDRIFDKFYQGDTSRKSFGNGLGMTLVDRIVKIYNGHLNIESDYDKGTRVSVILPKASSLS